jgi:hypothetical protein
VPVNKGGRGGPQDLLIGKPVPGSTTLKGRRGPQELLIGTYVPREQLFSGVGENAHYEAEVLGALAPRHICLPEETDPT